MASDNDKGKKSKKSVAPRAVRLPGVNVEPAFAARCDAECFRLSLSRPQLVRYALTLMMETLPPAPPVKDATLTYHSKDEETAAYVLQVLRAMAYEDFPTSRMFWGERSLVYTDEALVDELNGYGVKPTHVKTFLLAHGGRRRACPTRLIKRLLDSQ